MKHLTLVTTETEPDGFNPYEGLFARWRQWREAPVDAIFERMCELENALVTAHTLLRMDNPTKHGEKILREWATLLLTSPEA